MFIKHLSDCEEFIAGDESVLRQIFNPLESNLELRYSFAHAVVKPENITLFHCLKNSSEVYYIIKGEGIMYINDEQEKVSSGDMVYIPPFSKQRIKNTGSSDLEFICIVDPAWKKENEVIF